MNDIFNLSSGSLVAASTINSKAVALSEIEYERMTVVGTCRKEEKEVRMGEKLSSVAKSLENPSRYT